MVKINIGHATSCAASCGSRAELNNFTSQEEEEVNEKKTRNYEQLEFLCIPLLILSRRVGVTEQEEQCSASL